MTLLTRSSIRYLLRHPALLTLSILGVAVGVAVVVSIDLANSSAKRAFRLSSESVAGRATHRITGPTGSVPDSVYVNLRVRHGVRGIAPVVEGSVVVEGYEGRALGLLGVDPFADAPFRNFTGPGSGHSSGEHPAFDLGAFIGREPAMLLPASIAAGIGAQPGDRVAVSVQARSESIRLVGFLGMFGNGDDGRDEGAGGSEPDLVVTDISTAKRLMRLPDRLSRIDVRAESDAEIRMIESLLPSGFDIERASARSETLEQMTRAFELNLQALSLLALVVGMFLTYNTISFSVVQRRRLIGRLRAVGVTRGEIFGSLTVEALLVGAVGTIFGLLGGIVLAGGLLQLITRTINDLYFSLSVQELVLPAGVLVKGAMLGIGATLLAAWIPARRAVITSPADVLRRSSEEMSTQSSKGRVALAGALLAGVGAVILSLPSEGIIVGYAGILAILVGWVLVMPAAVDVSARGLRRAIGSRGGPIGRMAAGGVSANLSRTSVAVAALMVAVAASTGVGIMVGSFRTTVGTWLEQVLQADVYIQPPSSGGGLAEAGVLPAAEDTLRQTAGVREAYAIRRTEVRTSLGRVELAAVETGPHSMTSTQLVEGDVAVAIDRLRAGRHVLVSEPLAWRHDLSPGDSIAFETPGGRHTFAVAGVYFDYASDQGVVMMERSIYSRIFQDESISGLAVFVEEGMELPAMIERLRRTTSGVQNLVFRSNADLRAYSLDVFDRTFTVTAVLRLLTVVVAFVGILSALMALQLERRREFAVLRAAGMTRRQLARMIRIQCGIMGLQAGILAIPLGLALAWTLIHVINLRSFGWTLQFDVGAGLLLQGVGVAFVAALAAGWMPSRWISRISPTEAVRTA